MSTVIDAPGAATSWNSPQAAREFEALREKTANIGGDQETQFEQAFASLAYTYIKDKAPRLLDFMVGFQLVDRNDDNTKAIGVFGFKVGKSWVYAPVFFLNSDLKGHELLYLKEQDMFVPMKENWINYILSKKPHVLGNSVQGDLRQMGVQQPDIRGMAIPPHGSKFGSVHSIPIYPNAADGWMPPAEGFAPIYGAMTAGSLMDGFEAALTKHAGFRAEDLLYRFVRESVEHCKYAMDTVEAYPTVAAAMDQFYGPEFFKTALTDLRDNLEKSAGLEENLSAVVTDYHFGGGAKKKKKKKEDKKKAKSLSSVLRGSSVLGEPEKQAAGPAVTIRVEDDVLITQNGDDLAELSDEEAEAVNRRGYLVKDERTGEEVSKAYNTQIEMQLVNPDGSGLYEILQKPGDFVKTLVLASPHACDGRKDMTTAIRLDPKDWLNTHRTNLWGKPNTTNREDFEEWYGKQSEKTSLEEGGVYVAVSENGEGTVPFTVERKLSGEGRYEIWCHKHSDRRRPDYLPATAREQSPGGTHGPQLLYLEDREGRKFRSSSNILHVPREHVILTLKKPEESACGCFGLITESKDTSFEPGSLADLQLQVLQKTASIKIYATDNEACINNEPMLSKMACLFSLVKEHGLRIGEAREMMKKADRARISGNRSKFRIIYGPSYPLTKQAYGHEYMGQGPAAPGFPEQGMGYDPAYGQMATQYPEEYNQPVEGMDSGMTDPSVYSPLPEHLPDPSAMQQASQAGQMGQKEVFDTAMITGLLKAVRQDSLVDRYMGDLLKALDRLGRVLFMFYWHADEFQDRYGKGDMPELEDTLRNSFENLGELVLFLKEKDVEPLMRGDDSDPDVEESARN